MAENIGLDNLGEQQEEDGYEYEETSFIDKTGEYDDFNKSFEVLKGVYDEDELLEDPKEFSKKLIQETDRPATETDGQFEGRLAKFIKAVKKQRAAGLTKGTKKFFAKKMNATINLGDGPASQNILRKSRVVFNRKGELMGLDYNGKRMLVPDEDGKFNLNPKANKKDTIKFDELYSKAVAEHKRTAKYQVEKATGREPQDLNYEDVNYIVESIVNDLWDEVAIKLDQIETENELDPDSARRNIVGILESNDLDAIEINKRFWEDRAAAEQDPRKKQQAQSVVDTCALRIGQLRMVRDMPPIEGEIDERINNNILTRFERFKEWSKKNMGALAASIAVSIAGIITTVVLAGKGGVVTAAKATGALGKAIAKLTKAVWPVLAPLLSILATALSWGAQGLLWLSQNLWALAIGLTYFLYAEYKKYRSNK